MIDLMVERAAQIVDPREAAATEAELHGLAKKWAEHNSDGSLRWSRRGLTKSARLGTRWLIDSQEDRDSDRGGAFVAPNSLREVEEEVPVYLLGVTGHAP